MDTKYIFTILVLLTSSFYEVASRPSQSESFPLADGQTFEQPDTIQDEIGRSAPPINIPDGEEITKNILDKINFVNKGLTRPHRQQFGVNNAQNINLEIDEELLAKIQDLITSGKINGFSDLKKQTVNNGLDDERTRVEYAKKLLHTQGNQLSTAPANIMASSVQYLPFYGGAKGQYLEIKKNNAGNVLSETIVSEEKISNDNVVKNNNENLLSKVLSANLQSLQTLSRSVLRLHNLGRKVGYLGELEKTSFKTQLMSLGEAASNTIKLIDEVGEDVDVLFKSNVTKREYEEEDNVEEEGVGVDSPDVPDAILEAAGTIAEAKPVGLAVVGEQGLAASRPIATAVATSGIAIAQPVATAIAGVNPPDLGLQINWNPGKTH